MATNMAKKMTAAVGIVAFVASPSVTTGLKMDQRYVNKERAEFTIGDYKIKTQEELDREFNQEAEDLDRQLKAMKEEQIRNEKAAQKKLEAQKKQKAQKKLKAQKALLLKKSDSSARVTPGDSSANDKEEAFPEEKRFETEEFLDENQGKKSLPPLNLTQFYQNQNLNKSDTDILHKETTSTDISTDISRSTDSWRQNEDEIKYPHYPEQWELPSSLPKVSPQYSLEGNKFNVPANTIFGKDEVSLEFNGPVMCEDYTKEQLDKMKDDERLDKMKDEQRRPMNRQMNRPMNRQMVSPPTYQNVPQNQPQNLPPQLSLPHRIVSQDIGQNLPQNLNDQRRFRQNLPPPQQKYDHRIISQ